MLNLRRGVVGLVAVLVSGVARTTTSAQSMHPSL